MTIAFPKPGRAKKDPAYMALVAQLPCAICGVRPVEVHHCICGRGGRKRSSDRETIPLCFDCHLGPKGFHNDRARWMAENGPDTKYLPETERLVNALKGETI